MSANNVSYFPVGQQLLFIFLIAYNLDMVYRSPVMPASS